MHVEIKNIIVHEVRRVRESNKSTETLIVKIKDEPNDLKVLSDDLSTKLCNLFYKSGLMVGQFSLESDSEAKPLFEQTIQKFYSDENGVCSNFTNMSVELARQFESILSKNKNISGGFLVFFEITSEISDKLCIAVINKSNATDLDENLEFIVKAIMDIDKLHLGATINITDWLSGNSERYIRFKNGISEDITNYFQQFIGCDVDKKAAAEETRKLKDAINNFSANQLKLTLDERNERLASVHSYITDCIKRGDDVSLDHLSNHVFPAQSSDFFEYASNEYNLSSTLKISKNILKSYKKLASKNNNLSISFERDLLHDKITYEDEDGILKIQCSLLSEDLLNELKASQSSDE